MSRRLSMNPRAQRPPWRRMGIALGAALLGLAPRGAAAGLSVEHLPDVDGCTEMAMYFPEDESVQAQRARSRCRLETFERKLEDDRARNAAVSNQQRQQAIDNWMQKNEIPNRILRRNSIDLFASTGLTSYGVAVGGVFLPWLEAELWIGRRDLSESIPTGMLWDSRTCLGARFKWLMRSRGNLTPFASLGAAGCAANIQFDPYNFGGPFLPGSGGPVSPPTNSTGDAAAHLGTAAAGLAWLDKSGFRASLEYLFTYAYYTQASLNDAMRTQDANLRAAWETRLTSERGGVRLQVGYAF